MELGLSLAINYSVPLKIGLFKTILGPINMKVWFGGLVMKFYSKIFKYLTLRMKIWVKSLLK